MKKDKTPPVVLLRPVPLIFPASPYVGGVNPYGSRTQAGQGVNFICPEGTAVLAAHDSIVGIAKEEKDAYGKRIWLYTELPNATVRICYAHLSKIFVRVGQHVKEGQEIGLSGSSGQTGRPNLRFEVRLLPEDRPIKPDFYSEENVLSILRSL